MTHRVKVIGATMDQFLYGDIDLGDIIEDQIILLRVRCPNTIAWYRVDALVGLDIDITPPKLRSLGRVEARKRLLRTERARDTNMSEHEAELRRRWALQHDIYETISWF
jgi:hypothetical protein